MVGLDLAIISENICSDEDQNAQPLAVLGVEVLKEAWLGGLGFEPQGPDCQTASGIHRNRWRLVLR